MSTMEKQEERFLVSEEELKTVGATDEQIMNLRLIIDAYKTNDLKIWRRLTDEEKGPGGRGRQIFPNWLSLRCQDMLDEMKESKRN